MESFIKIDQGRTRRIWIWREWLSILGDLEFSKEGKWGLPRILPLLFCRWVQIFKISYENGTW